MAVIIKTEQEIQNMREGGKHHAEILQNIAKLVRPGISTWELDQAAEQMIKDFGDKPAFKGYKPDGAKTPYPATLITSVNEEVVHGIPSKKEFFKKVTLSLLILE
jgi:methionyl aminopeptidase